MMRMGLGLNLRRRGGVFNPATIVTSAWYDPSDLSSMWQDSAGTTPAAVNSPVGKINDKSGNGFHLIQPTAAARPVLRQSGDLYYLQFDGSDDQLLTPASNFPLASVAGESTQVAAVSFAELAAVGQVMFASVGGRRDFRKAGNALQGIAFNAASAAIVDSGPTFTAGEKLVMTLNLTAAGVLNMCKNRVSDGTASGAPPLQGDGLCTLYLGGSNTAGEYMAGNFYGGAWMSRAVSAADIYGIEQWAAAKAGVTL